MKKSLLLQSLGLALMSNEMLAPQNVKSSGSYMGSTLKGPQKHKRKSKNKQQKQSRKRNRK